MCALDKWFTYLHKLFGEFKGRALKAQVVPGRIGQDEAKVDVNQVPLGVQQNVAIVSGGKRRWKLTQIRSQYLPGQYTIVDLGKSLDSPDIDSTHAKQCSTIWTNPYITI